MKALGNNRRTWIIAVVAALALAIMFIVAAPASNRINSGSSWSTAPDGYGAWYDYMAEQGVTVQRWQRPLDDLIEEVANSDRPATLLQVRPAVLSGGYRTSSIVSDWIEQGNHLISLSHIDYAVSAAKFVTQMPTEFGEVKIETRRRVNLARSQRLLSDAYGSVVWRQERSERSASSGSGSGSAEQASVVQGTQIRSLTPNIAANAYQNEPGNFAFLADLVQQLDGPIYIDEYIHGYKDSDVVVEEVAGSWISYLGATPLLIAAAQCLIIVLVAIVAQNRRLGLKKQIAPVQVNNSDAYIQALAGVLHKANNHDFLVETLTRAERRSLQRSLGLGDGPISTDALQTAWQQATGRSPNELSALTVSGGNAPRSESALKNWLQRLQSLHLLANQPNPSEDAPTSNP